MKTCSETSSVKITSAPAAWSVVCVTEGLSLERRKRPCEPFWSHSMYLRGERAGKGAGIREEEREGRARA